MGSRSRRRTVAVSAVWLTGVIGAVTLLPLASRMGGTLLATTVPCVRGRAGR